MKYYILGLLLASFSLVGQTKKICITVDDLPTVPYGIDDNKFNKDLTQNLINAFNEYNIPAIGFVNEGKLYKKNGIQSSKLDLLEMWLRNGYELGNHTFSHHNYDQVDFETYTQDLIKGEKVVKPLALTYNIPYRFFRHPYLRMGATKGKADSLSSFIMEHNYIIAPVTIDNEDYVFAKAYHIAFSTKDEILMAKIGKDYVDYMEKKLLFYEDMSEKLFDRNIAQTLLCHASLLNATYMPQLAEMYVINGYTFVSQAEALEDPAYNSTITRFGKYGISWMDRWALSQGKKGEFFKDDPETPVYIKELFSK